jgi:acyl-CoA thioester hydrolase
MSMADGWDLPEPFVETRSATRDEIDGYGHVNNAVYVAWLDSCAWAHATALSLGPDVCRRLNRGMAVWRTQINYLGAALERDTVGIATWPVLNDGRLRIDRRFQIRRRSDGATLLRALLHYVCIDLETGKARRMPAEFRGYRVAPAVQRALEAETEAFQPGVEPR